jgi:hypothetical protein
MDAAKNKKDFDKSIADAADAKVSANQKVKEKVGAEFASARADYMALHPPAKN